MYEVLQPFCSYFIVLLVELFGLLAAFFRFVFVGKFKKYRLLCVRERETNNVPCGWKT